MSKYNMVMILGMLLFFPFLAQADLLWFDDFEQDSIGGPAQGWGYPYSQYSDTTWKVVMDGSTKVYRRCSGDSSVFGGIFAIGFDPPPVAFTAQVKIKVTDFFPNSSPYFYDEMVGFLFGGNIHCYFSPCLDDRKGLFLSDFFLNTIYFAFCPVDLELNCWYYFKMGQSDTVGWQPPQIYFKVWPEKEEEPSHWTIHPGPGGWYRPPTWWYGNLCVFLPDSICHHYLGLMAHATYANFDELMVFSELEGIEDHNDLVVIPKAFELHQNYPNPFNSSTTICYSIPDEGESSQHIILKIFNTLGERVRTLANEEHKSGDYKVIWNGNDNQGKEVVSGIYLCQLRCGDLRKTRKLVLLR